MSNNLEYFFRLPQDEKKKGLFGRAPAPAKIASVVASFGGANSPEELKQFFRPFGKTASPTSLK